MTDRRIKDLPRTYSSASPAPADSWLPADSPTGGVGRLQPRELARLSLANVSGADLTAPSPITGSELLLLAGAGKISMLDLATYARTADWLGDGSEALATSLGKLVRKNLSAYSLATVADALRVPADGGTATTVGALKTHIQGTMPADIAALQAQKASVSYVDTGLSAKADAAATAAALADKADDAAVSAALATKADAPILNTNFSPQYNTEVGSVSGINYQYNSGWWCRIGRVVFFQIGIKLQAGGTRGSQNVCFDGLPYPAIIHQHPVSTTYDFAAAMNPSDRMVGRIDGFGRPSAIRLYVIKEDGMNGQAWPVNIGDEFEIHFAGHYLVDDGY